MKKRQQENDITNITREILFFEVHAENEVGRLVQDLSLFL